MRAPCLRLMRKFVFPFAQPPRFRAAVARIGFSALSVPDLALRADIGDSALLVIDNTDNLARVESSEPVSESHALHRCPS